MPGVFDITTLCLIAFTVKEEGGLRGRGFNSGHRSGDKEKVFRAKAVWFLLIGPSSAIKCIHTIMA